MNDDRDEEDDGRTEYVEIPARMSRGESIDTSTVPRDWYEHRERVYDAKEVLVEEYLDRPEVSNISITKGDRTSENGEIALLQVRVGLDDTSFASEIPDRVGDVGVEKIEAKRRTGGDVRLRRGALASARCARHTENVAERTAYPRSAGD